jgi:hypothetical protein
VSADSAAAVERVWGRLPAGTRAALEADLSATDLQTLLLAVAKARAAEVTPARVAARWREDAFVRPAEQDPRLLAAVEAQLWALLPEEYAGLELSPVAPFGTCAAVAGVDQNRVLTTTRTSEVVSDQTAVLALEAARRRAAAPDGGVHLASMHRVLRTQRFPTGSGQHFRLLALVSSSRDAGSGRTEADLLVRHLEFYAGALSVLLPADLIRIRLTAFSTSATSERLADTVMPALDPLPDNVELVLDPDRTRGRGYYRDVALRIDVVSDGVELEIGDGGFTDWTARLLADAKERCLTSCIATERLASRTSEVGSPSMAG